MTTNIANKAIDFHQFLSACDWDSASKIISEDVIFTGPDGEITDWPSLRDMLASARQVMAEPLNIKITGVTAENDRVALEIEANADLLNGKKYSNRYHFAMIFENGLLKNMIEYCDTTAHTVFED